MIEISAMRFMSIQCLFKWRQTSVFRDLTFVTETRNNSFFFFFIPWIHRLLNCLSCLRSYRKPTHALATVHDFQLLCCALLFYKLEILRDVLSRNLTVPGHYLRIANDPTRSPRCISTYMLYNHELTLTLSHEIRFTWELLHVMFLKVPMKLKFFLHIF